MISQQHQHRHADERDERLDAPHLLAAFLAAGLRFAAAFFAACARSLRSKTPGSTRTTLPSGSPASPARNDLTVLSVCSSLWPRRTLIRPFSMTCLVTSR